MKSIIYESRCRPTTAHLRLTSWTPCETWSSARFAQFLHPDGSQRRGPRPVRLALYLWGILELTTKELQQVSVGNVLFLKGLWLATVVALHRGAVILEHPVVPFEDFKPSIWRTAVNLLMRPPFSLFARATIHQWRYGSPMIVVIPRR